MIERDWKFEKIKKYKENALRENIYNKGNVKKYKECPYCGSKSFIKYGNYNRIQRYKCKNEECKKTFSNTTNSVWKYLKHKPEKWFEFIELMGEHTTLNECSYKLGISIVTAFHWRHKIFHAIENNYKPEKFDEVVDVDTYYTEKCYKGSRNKNYTYADKVKNKFDKMYGLVPRNVSVLIAEERGKMPLIRRTENDETIVNNFNNNVLKIAAKDCYMRTDHFTNKKLKNNLLQYNKKLSNETKKKYGLKIIGNRIEDKIKEDKKKNIMAYLTAWLSRCKGIATKYINHYYNFYSLIDSEKVFDYMSIFFDLLKNGSYTSVEVLRTNHVEDY